MSLFSFYYGRHFYGRYFYGRYFPVTTFETLTTGATGVHFCGEHFHYRYFYEDYWPTTEITGRLPVDFEPQLVGYGYFDHLPRWVNAYYDPNSLFRKLYLHAIVAPLMDVRWNFTFRPIVPQFYLPTCYPGDLYTTDLGDIQVYEMPDFEIVCGDPWLYMKGIRFCLTIDSLLEEKEEPVWTYDSENVLFNNIDMVSFRIKSASGSVDLAPAFLVHPILPDSPIIVTDPIGMTSVLDQSDPHITPSGKLYVPIPGDYVIKYRSSKIRDMYASGLAWVSRNGLKRKPVPTRRRNLIDDTAALAGCSRRPLESNASLLDRARFVILSKDPYMKIAGCLGLGTLVQWTYREPLNLAGSGVTMVQIEGYEKIAAVTASGYPGPSGTILFRIEPDQTRSTHVGYRNEVFYPSMYDLQGSTLRVLDERYKAFPPESFVVRHLRRFASVTRDASGFVSGISWLASQSLERPLFVLLSKQIAAKTLPHRPVLAWNVEAGVTPNNSKSVFL